MINNALYSSNSDEWATPKEIYKKLDMELGEQADILYLLLTEQMAKAEIKSESEDRCKNCEYSHNPDYTRCHECKAESEAET